MDGNNACSLKQLNLLETAPRLLIEMARDNLVKAKAAFVLLLRLSFVQDCSSMATWRKNPSTF